MNRVIILIFLSILSLSELVLSAESRFRLVVDQITDQGHLENCRLLADDSMAIAKNGGNFRVSNGKIYLTMKDVSFLSWKEKMNVEIAATAEETSEIIEGTVFILIGSKFAVEMELSFNDKGEVITKQGKILLVGDKKGESKVLPPDLRFVEISKEIEKLDNK